MKPLVEKDLENRVDRTIIGGSRDKFGIEIYLDMTVAEINQLLAEKSARKDPASFAHQPFGGRLHLYVCRQDVFNSSAGDSGKGGYPLVAAKWLIENYGKILEQDDRVPSPAMDMFKEGYRETVPKDFHTKWTASHCLQMLDTPEVAFQRREGEIEVSWDFVHNHFQPHKGKHCVPLTDFKHAIGELGERTIKFLNQLHKIKDCKDYKEFVQAYGSFMQTVRQGR